MPPGSTNRLEGRLAHRERARPTKGPPPGARYPGNISETEPFVLGRRPSSRACPQSEMQAVTVISISSSGAFSDATVTVVRAGLLVGKYFAYSSL